MSASQLELPTSTEMHDVYRRIRNYLAGRVIGITRDQSLLDEVVKCLFCYSQLLTGNRIDEVKSDPESISKTYRTCFSELKLVIPHIFEKNDEILLDPSSIEYVHNELSLLDFFNPDKDPLGELYQAFIGSDLRMAEGQFFTPYKAVRWLVEATSPKPGEKIIDPACGPGGFLSQSAKVLLEKGVSRKEINKQIHGVEKDLYLSKLAHAHLSLITLCKSKIDCADSIEKENEDGKKVSFLKESYFDVVLANPPFGAKIKSGKEETRKTFELAHKWKLDKESNIWEKQNLLQKNTPPQILFIELCIKLLKPGGRLGIVVPESMISNSSTAFVVDYIRRNLQIQAVSGMPESLFKTSGKGGTHTKTCLIVAVKKKVTPRSKIFMAEAKWCGHDSRGNAIPHNDLPSILDNFMSKNKKTNNHLGYYISGNEIKNNILAPRYYDPEPITAINSYKKSHEIVCVEDLIKDGILSFSTGDEVGKLAYGTGNIPFIRTSDISNWEIKFDPKHCVSQEIYDSLSKKQDIKAGDILMVRDGTYLIGSCAFISEYDEKIVYQSHLYKIRTNPNKLISPYLLLALFSCEPVIRQIKAKRFTQDIIDTLGKRVNELLLPIPKDIKAKERIEKMVFRSIQDKIEARELAKKAKIEILTV